MQINHLALPFQIKDIDAAGVGVFTGYGSVFNVPDSHDDVVVPGAFKNSLATWKKNKKQPALLWMHDPTKPVGVWESIEENETGLAVKGKLVLESQAGQEAYALVKAGAVTGLSIGYRVIKSGIDPVRKLRLLNEIKLYEISLVTFPANEAAQVDDVKAADQIKSVIDFEKALRDELGYSHARARAIARHGFKAGTEPRDGDVGLEDELPEPRDGDVQLKDLLDGIKRCSQILQPNQQ